MAVPVMVWGLYGCGESTANPALDADQSQLIKEEPRGRSFRQFDPERLLPSQCRDCIDATGVSIGIRDVFGPGRIAFRIADTEGVLLLPFPVFESWTDFGEDEYFE